MLVLLDRDGVINEDLPTGVLKFEEFVFLPRAIEAIVKLTQAGFNSCGVHESSRHWAWIDDPHQLSTMSMRICALKYRRRVEKSTKYIMRQPPMTCPASGVNPRQVMLARGYQ
jgi:hypothetical protein